MPIVSCHEAFEINDDSQSYSLSGYPTLKGQAELIQDAKKGLDSDVTSCFMM